MARSAVEQRTAQDIRLVERLSLPCAKEKASPIANEIAPHDLCIQTYQKATVA